jgi:hypothetical protein
MEVIEAAIVKLRAVADRLHVDPEYRRGFPEGGLEEELEILQSVVGRLDHHSEVVAGLPLSTLEETLGTLRAVAGRLDTHPEYIRPLLDEEPSDTLLKKVFNFCGSRSGRSLAYQKRVKVARPESGHRGVLAVELGYRGFAEDTSAVFPCIGHYFDAVSGFTLLDADRRPVGGVRYKVDRNGHTHFEGVSSDDGRCDLLPYGALGTGGRFVYGHTFIDLERGAEAAESVLYIRYQFLVLSDEIRNTLVDFAGDKNLYLPREFDFYVSPHNEWKMLPPIPGRTYYHNSAHPEGGCTRACKKWCRFDALSRAAAARTIQRAARRALCPPEKFHLAGTRFEAASSSAAKEP